MREQDRVTVLVAAGAAAWEVAALESVQRAAPRLVLVKRCVDLPDLLATAATGRARAAVVDLELPGLDADSIDHLRRHGVGAVAVAADGDGATAERAQRLGLGTLVTVAGLARGELPEALRRAASGPAAGSAGAGPAAEAATPETAGPAAVTPGARPAAPGTLVAVWGPTGAPGRTTVATGLAAELAERGHQTLLLDADGFGGSVAQHLGVLDEASGLLAAARLGNAGRLDGPALAGVTRRLAPRLTVLTGLPRADRWVEVRERAFTELLAVARTVAAVVVVDVGFCLEEDPDLGAAAGLPQRHLMTRTALAAADEVVVVGAADPVGLTRLARGLVELGEVAAGVPVRVVVNRSRPSLGWSEREVRAMVEGFLAPRGVHFLPDDRATADRALVAGRTLVELGDSPLRRGVAEVAAALAPAGGSASPGRRPGRVSRRPGRRRLRR